MVMFIAACLVLATGALWSRLFPVISGSCDAHSCPSHSLLNHLELVCGGYSPLRISSTQLPCTSDLETLMLQRAIPSWLTNGETRLGSKKWRPSL